MSYYLFLDDTRKPSDVNWVDLPLVEWTIVRDYKQFVDTIKSRGMPEFIAFDHDLADEHYGYTGEIGRDDEYEEHRKKYKEKTGYECALWVINYCVDNNLKMCPHVAHSVNPVGRSKINGAFESYKRHLEQK